MQQWLQRRLSDQKLPYAYRNQLRLSSLEEHPVLISESTWQSKENRERLLELAFEGWGAPAYYTVDKNVLTAFSVGKGTAMVLDVGEDVSSCMPIYDGFVIRKGGLLNMSKCQSSYELQLIGVFDALSYPQVTHWRLPHDELPG